jgi:hypothetical protein
LVAHASLEEAEAPCQQTEETDEVARIAPQDHGVTRDPVRTMPGKV